MHIPNSVKTSQNIEVYESKIHELADEYINTQLRDPEDIYNNGSLFNGMIKYIQRHLFKANESIKTLNNTGTVLNLNDIKLLNDIWNVYTDLCYRYGKRPTILNFSILINIDRQTINEWKTGKARASHATTVQKWFDECESALIDGATEKNSIGCIFALKSCYGYTEAPQRLEITNGQTPEAVASDIANRRLSSDSVYDMPTLPDIDG